MSIILKENETMQDVVEKLGFSTEWIYEIAPIAYWYENLHENGRIKDIHFSKRMREMLGYKSVEEFPDELNTLMTFTHPDDVQIMLQGAIDAGTGKTDKYDVQYRIRKADGSYLWCNATGQQIKNHDGVIVGMYGAFIDISEEIELKREQEKRQRSKELIESFAKNYEATFLGNLNDGSYAVISNKSPLYGFFQGKNTLPEAFKAYFEHVAHPIDRKRIEKNHYSQTEIREKFAIGDTHALEYRRKIGQAYYWYRVAFNRINENEILVGFVNCDQEHTSKLVTDKLISEYDAIYVVALDRGRIRPARPSKVSSVGAFTEDRDYKSMLLQFAETVAPKYRQDWINFSEPEYVKQYMAKDDHREYVYELPGAGRTMRRLSIDVIERIEDEVKAVLLSFMGIDDTRAEAIRLHSQIAEQSAKIEALNSRYAFLHKAVKASVWSYEINERDEVISANYDEYAGKNPALKDTEAPMSWVEALHPEDKERVLGEFMAAIHDHSCNTPYDTTYRFKYSKGGYLWLKTYGKLNRRDDGTAELYGISVNITQQIEKEQEQTRQIQESFDRVNQANLDNELVLSFVNGIRWSYEIGADDKIISAHYGESAVETYDANHLDDPMAWVNLIHPEDKERVLDVFMPMLHDRKGKKKADLTYRIKGLDGKYRWNKVSGRVRLHEDGTRELFGINIDVTAQMNKERKQQKQLEAALGEAEKVNRALDEANRHEMLKSDAFGFMVKNEDLESFVNFFSERVLDLYGCDQVIYRDIEGRQILKERPGTKPLDFSLCANCPHYEFNAPVYAGGFTAMDDCKVGYNGIPVHPDCRVRASLTYLVYENDKIFGYIALHYLDGTHHFTDAEKNTFDRVAKFMSMVIARRKYLVEIKEKNARFDIVKDVIHSAEWRFTLSADDKIVGHEYSSNIGALVHNEKAFEKHDWKDFVHPDDLNAAQDAFNACIKDHSGKTPYDVIYRMIDRDGKYNWFRSAGRVIRNKDGSGDFFGLHFDITDTIEKERETQRQLEEALAMAQSASRAKTTFLNNMSHDIRTPMNAIIGFTGLAASHIDNKQQVQDYLTKIGQSSDHLLSLINDVLDMSRIESGKMNLDEKPENLPAIIHTLRDIVQADIRAKQHDFFIDTVNVNDEDIVCDKLRLNQVLLNILSNAIKYTANGGIISLRITEKAVKPSGYATYEFCIKDNGMGMDAEFQKTIFDPFTRMKSSTVSGIQGTGLGMAITKNIIDMMGGAIDIQSVPGKGTQMTVTFDFRLQSAPKETKSIPELKGLRGLVVDDDADTCMSITGMLRDIGMRDEWCVTGKEAVLRAAEAHRIGDSFKVYIIDWLMPDMNGIETTRRIRKVIGDDIPIIILTAYDWSDIEEEAREAGVTAFVSKPMFPSDLHRVLNNCLGKTEENALVLTDDFDFTGKRILLVEDNELNREIGVELLTEYGCIIDTASDGTIAVEKMKDAKEGDYDAILMDIQMPIMNGYEATKAIRALGTPISKIPILAMTADAFAEDRKRALEVGMNDHITKPINIKLLRQMLAKYL